MDKEPEVKGEDGERDTIAGRGEPAPKEPKPRPKKSCFWDGKRYSHGGVVKGPDGKMYKCDDGAWVHDYEVTVGEAVLEREAPSQSSRPEQAS